MTVIFKDADHQLRPAPATVGELVDRLVNHPCEADFVFGDCNSPENAPYLPDVTGGQPCWPCLARRIRKAVPA